MKYKEKKVQDVYNYLNQISRVNNAELTYKSVVFA